jgi:hypothetical protein
LTPKSKYTDKSTTGRKHSGGYPGSKHKDSRKDTPTGNRTHNPKQKKGNDPVSGDAKAPTHNPRRRGGRNKKPNPKARVQ